MYRFFYFSVLAIFLFHSNNNCLAVEAGDSVRIISWQELMDSCSASINNNNFQTALKWALLAEEKSKADFGEIDTNYADNISTLTYINFRMLKFKDALVYARKDSALRLRLKGAEDPSYIRALNNIAAQYLQLGMTDDAINTYKETININKKVFPYDSACLLIPYRNIASAYQKKGLINDAGFFLNRILAIERNMIKVDSQMLSYDIHELAVVLFKLDRLPEAEKLMAEELEIKKRIYKSEDPAVAATLNNIGSVYQAEGKFTEAEEAKIKSLNIYRNLYKSDNPELATSIHNLATFYNAVDMLGKADTL